MGEVLEIRPARAVKQYSLITVVLIGFWIGASLPVLYGYWWIAQETAYRNSLPTGPDFGDCGMGSLGATLMYFFVGPILSPVCGALGAGVSALSLWAMSSERQQS